MLLDGRPAVLHDCWCRRDDAGHQIMQNKDAQEAEMVRVNLTLPAEMMERAKRHATRRGSSVSQVIRDALFSHLAKMDQDQ